MGEVYLSLWMSHEYICLSEYNCPSECHINIFVPLNIFFPLNATWIYLSLLMYLSLWNYSCHMSQEYINCIYAFINNIWYPGVFSLLIVSVWLMHKYILIKCVFVGLRPSGHFTDLKATKYINGPLIFPSPLLNVLIIYGKSTKCPKDRLKIFLSERKSVFLRSLVDLNLEKSERK